MLELYKNIKSRRIELEMSQQELSSLVGYSGKSMISKIERGEVDLSQTMIQKFADALRTTPGELIGMVYKKKHYGISICIIIYCYYTFCITFFIKNKMKI